MPPSSAPSPAQILLYTGARAAVLEGAYQLLGRPEESGTLAALEQAALATILGDGTTAHPGIGSPQWQAVISSALNSSAAGAAYQAYFARQSLLMRTLDDLVQGSLPPGWRYLSPRPFDAHLTRLNGTFAAPPPPGAAGALTAVQSASGALPNTLSSAGPRVVHTLVGAADEYESMPSAEATQTAIAGAANSYTYQIAGTVPSGIKKVRLYRTPFGASGPPYSWDQDVAVSAGASYLPIAIEQPDGLLRFDLLPPQWMQCALRPAAAALYALAFASAGGAGGAIAVNPGAMISPGSVLLGPANGYIGLGNPPQSALFGQSALTALNTATFTAGGIRTLNAPNLQGFAGASGLRARCTAALNGTLTPTVTITYFDAAHGWGSAQTTGGLTPSSGFTSGLVGDFALFTIPAGQIIQAVTQTSVSGSATAGSWVYEAR